jgi:FAD/FMN-containing dehydrogenase
MMRLTSLLLAGLCALQPSLANPLSKRDALNDCLADANVPHHEENSTAWNRDARPFNERLYYEPAAIAVPRNTSEIQAAVACGARHGVKVAAKCGGHSYASFGLGGADGHLVLELDGMHKVTVGANGRATIQGGARLGHVAVELFAQGGRAIPHGTCPG